METLKNDDALKILLVLDDSAEKQRIETLLSNTEDLAFRLHSVANLTGALEALSAWSFDAILLNLYVSGCPGMETFQKVYQSAPRIPIIVLEDSGAEDLIVGLAEQGAHDCLARDEIDDFSLPAAIHVAVESNKREQALRQSEKKFRTIIETLEDAYFETDLNGSYTYVNDTLCRHLQRSREEIIGRTCTDFSTAESAEHLKKVFKQVLAKGGTDEVVEDEIIRKDGLSLFAEISLMLMHDADGQAVGFRGISRDVTEKKNAEQALKESEEKYRNILASIEDGYFEVDLNGVLTFFNDAMYRIFGCSRKELMASSYRDFMKVRTARKVKLAFNAIYRTGEPDRALQYAITRKDGTVRYLESTVSLMKDDKEQPIGFRGVARDISQRKLAEQELARAKEKAEEATLAKSDFLANMSHEIRTPMNGIIGMYNLLLGTDLTSEQADFVETGKRSADSLLAVINDILDFSKIEAGKLDIELINFDLRKSIEEIVALPAMQAHAKGVEFIYQVDHDVPSFIIGDPGRLRQIIMNLATNAIKFTKRGEVVFSVFLEKEIDNKAMIRFEMRDTGIGISQEDQKRLFQSFHQVDASTTRKYGGTGLGLAISKRLTEMMGGQMGVSSRVQEGSTFWFTALFEKQSDMQERILEVPENLQDKRILIVDDNQTNLNILSVYLNRWGCSCDQALNGEMALSLMRAVTKAGAPYDLVISDMLMPEMDGAELGRQIKADAALRNTILVMLTSQGLRGDAAEMKRVGFSAYLTKPVRRSQLFDCIISVFNQSRQALEVKKSPQTVPSTSIDVKNHNSVTVLLVEDNPINQKLAIHLITKFGFKVDAVTNGKLALEALEKCSYDLVLMDIQMPEMDGLEATRVIRNPHSTVLNHDIPIIALTAHAMKGDREKCLNAGMDDYVSKPIHPDSLLKAIERRLSSSDKKRPNQAQAM